jgi:dephospho-CoA kinase
VSERQVRVLLTGGIGSGKSSVGEMLRARGAQVIDADEIGHRVLESGGEAYARVAGQWPAVLVDGAIDRKRLADIVFRDREALEMLEGITHEAIRRRVRDLIAGSLHRLIVVEVPLLTDFMGAGWIRVVVDADRQTRMDRLRARGLDHEDVARRMAAQPDREDWLAAADFVIDNRGNSDDLEEQVEALWRRLTEQSGERSSTDRAGGAAGRPGDSTGRAKPPPPGSN